MMKLSMRCVLWSALSLAVMPLLALAADPGQNPSVAWTQTSFESTEYGELNVLQLAGPESRLTYDEIGKLLTVPAGAGEGRTSFNGTTIDVQSPPRMVTIDAAPVTISTPDCGASNVRPVNQGTISRMETSMSAWLNGGALPTVAHQPIGRHGIIPGNSSGKATAKAHSAAAPVRKSGRGKTGAAFGSQRR